jgi:transcriptional regulator with XRE-family HTH domain
MQQIGERIDVLCMALGISRRRFAEVIGENPSTIASIVRGTNPSANIICSILDQYPELNERWLLMGEGPLWKKDQIVPELKDEKYQEALKQQMESKNDTITALKGQVKALESMNDMFMKQIAMLERDLEVAQKINRKIS